MRQVHGGPQKVSRPADRLADCDAPVDHGLEVQCPNRNTGRAPVVARGDRHHAAPHGERAVELPETANDSRASAVERVGRGGAEDRIAFHLHKLELGGQAVDEVLQEFPEDAVAGRQARAEVCAMRAFDSGEERGVAGEIDQDEVALTRVAWERRTVTHRQDMLCRLAIDAPGGIRARTDNHPW